MKDSLYRGMGRLQDRREKIHLVNTSWEILGYRRHPSPNGGANLNMAAAIMGLLEAGCIPVLE